MATATRISRATANAKARAKSKAKQQPAKQAAKPEPAKPAKAKPKLPVVAEAEEAEVETPKLHKTLVKEFGYSHTDEDGNVVKPVSRNMLLWRAMLTYIHDHGPCTVEKLIEVMESKYGKCAGRINQCIKSETGTDAEGNPYRHNKRIRLLKGKLSWIEGVALPRHRGTAE